MITTRNTIVGCARVLTLCATILVLACAPAAASSCESIGPISVVVSLVPPAGKTIAGVVIDVDYPERAVSIPGHGDAPEVKARITRMPDGFLSSPNDHDDDLVVAIAGTQALPAGPVFTVEFDRCKGAPKAVAKDFRCKVEQASTDTGVLVDGTTCSAVITMGNLMHAKNTKKAKGGFL